MSYDAPPSRSSDTLSSQLEYVSDEYLIRLPPSQLAQIGMDAGMDAMRQLVARHGGVVRNQYSARVGLADTLHIRAPREGLSAMLTDWPGISVQRAVVRRLFDYSCGDNMCSADEKERVDRTTTCSVDCGAPPSRELDDELVNTPQAFTVGAVTSWPRTMGDGVRVCVLDTGYDSGPSTMHPDRPLNLEGGYNLPDDNPDFHATNLHGTHVTGIIAARPRQGMDPVQGMIGIAPNAIVRMYTVFSVIDGRLGASDGDIIAAVDRALLDRCQIINMSFGGGYDSTLEHQALSRAYAQGVLLIAAAGNSEDAAHGLIRTARNYPAAYPEVLAVGALTPDEDIAPFSSTGPVLQLSAPGVAIYSSVPRQGGDRQAVLTCDLPGRGKTTFAVYAPPGGSGTPLKDVPLSACGFGSVTDLTACSTPASGHIALMQRGPTASGTQALPFATKVENARLKGAVGIILFNHRSGAADQAGALLTAIDIGGGVPVPVVTLAAGDGEFLTERLRTNHDEIRCSISAAASDWAVLDGTSMAAPVVTGSAALVRAALPTLSNVQLRQLLIESAVDLGAPGRDEAYGFGRVDVERALAQSAPRIRCGDGKIDRTSEVCDGTAVDSASCEDLGFDGAGGGAVVCNAICSGLDTSACKCLPRDTPFDVRVSILRDYRKGQLTGTLAFYRVMLDGQPVRGAYAKVAWKRAGKVEREGQLGPSGADGSIPHYTPETGNGLPAGDYEVVPVITKAAGRCHDDLPLATYHVQIKS